MAVLGFALAGSILDLVNTPADMYSFSRDYLRIILIGIPFLAVYNTYSSVLRATGDSRAPFYSLLISSAANVFLDILFVAVLRYGVAGAAAATVISQISMTVFIIFYSMKHYPQLRFSARNKIVHWDIVRRGNRFGFPPAIQSGITSFGNIVLQNFMNGFGTHTVAAISVFLSIIMTFFGGRLVAMFGIDQEAIGISFSFFRSIAVFYIFYGIATAYRGTVEGTGDVMYSSIIGISHQMIPHSPSGTVPAAYGTAS